MPKRHLKNLTEQMADKGYASSPFHYSKNSNPGTGSIDLHDNRTTAAADEDSLRIRAYQIHQEKGGSDLDNWLEAEKDIKKSVSALINEGDPNIL